MTKSHELDDSETTESYVLTAMEAGSLGSGCQPGEVPREALPGLQSTHVALAGRVGAQKSSSRCLFQQGLGSHQTRALQP